MHSLRQSTRGLSFISVVVLFCLGAMTLTQAWAAETLNADFQKVAGYKFGQGREALSVVEEQVRTANGKPEELKRLESQLDALVTAPQATYEAKDFACRQLTLIGTEASVPALVTLMGDEKLSNMARYALERIPGEAPTVALRAELGKAKGLTRVGVINSLGVLRDKKSVAKLGGLLKNEDPLVAGAAARALGKIGGVDSAALLAKANKAGAKIPAPVLAIVKDSYLQCADSLLAADEKDKALAIYGKMYGAGEPFQIRLVALQATIKADPAQGMALVTAALKGEDAKMQAAVTRYVRQELPGAESTKAFAALLAGLKPAGQVLLVKALTDRGDKAAMAEVSALAASPDGDVRLAALQGLGALGDASSVGVLAKVSAAGEEPYKTVAEESLSRLSAKDVDETILAGLTGADVPTRLVLIRSLASRRMLSTTPELIKAAQDSDRNVQREAFTALGAMGEEKDIQPLVTLVTGAKSDRERGQAEKALISICGRNEDKNARTKAVLAALAQKPAAGSQCALLRVLGGLGGDEALKVVIAADKSATPEVKDTAVRALTEWPDAGPVNELSRIARKDANLTFRVLALRGYVRQLGLPNNRPIEETISLYQDGMKMAKSLDDKKMVLSGLGGASDPQVISLVEPYLANPELQAEAVASMVSLARASVNICPDLAKEALAKVQEVSKDEDVKKQVGEINELLKPYEDFITAWQVAGPYSEQGKSWQQLHDTVFAPETGKAKGAKWQMLKGVDPAKNWCMSLSKGLGDNKNCVAYARTNIWVPKAGKATFYAGSDDGLKIWLNGEVVLSKNLTRSVQPGEDTPSVTLKEGWNSVLLKVTQGDNDWGFSFRVRNPDVSVIQGLKVSMDGKASKKSAK